MSGEWEDIRTAPKDGTAVMLWGKLTFQAKVAACWLARWDAEGRDWLTDLTSDEDSVYLAEPTHWMPLPKPPTDGAPIEKGRSNSYGIGAG